MAQSVAWLVASSAVAQVFTLLASVLAGRLLGREGFGELGMVRSYVLMFGTFAGAGLGIAATKCMAQFRVTDRARAGRVIGMLANVALITGTLAAVVCFALAGTLAERTLAASHLVTPLRLCAVLIVCNAVSGVQVGALVGLEAYRAVASVSMVDGLLNVICITLGAWLGDVRGAMLGSIAVSAATIAVRYWLLRTACAEHGIVIDRRHLRGEWNLLCSVALPAAVVNVCNQPFEWLARLIVARQAEGFAELGMFVAAMSLAQIVWFLPQRIADATIPALAGQHAQGDLTGFRRLFRQSLLANLAAGLLTALCLACLARPLMSAYGPTFVPGWRALVVLLFTWVLAGLTIGLRSAFIGVGLFWYQTRHALIYGMSLVTLAAVLSRYGSFGFACSYAGAYTIMVTAQLITAARHGLLVGLKEGSTAAAHSPLAPCGRGPAASSVEPAGGEGSASATVPPLSDRSLSPTSLVPAPHIPLSDTIPAATSPTGAR